MMINRSSGNTRFVRTAAVKKTKGGSFGEALNKASYAKDTFDSSSVSGTAFTQSAVSSVSATQAKLDSISAAIKDTDYSGMTKAEIMLTLRASTQMLLMIFMQHLQYRLARNMK